MAINRALDRCAILVNQSALPKKTKQNVHGSRQ
jgi:hypothetical protein